MSSNPDSKGLPDLIINRGSHDTMGTNEDKSHLNVQKTTDHCKTPSKSPTPSMAEKRSKSPTPSETVSLKDNATLSGDTQTQQGLTSIVANKLIPESIRNAASVLVGSAEDAKDMEEAYKRRPSSPGFLPVAEDTIQPQGQGDDDHGAKSSSKSVMSKHAVELGCYTLNLGTETGQKIYSMLMIILPMVPLLILLGRLASNLAHNKIAERDLTLLRQEVMDALDITYLVQQLQEERAAVALNKFLWDMKSTALSMDSIKTISNLTKTDIDIKDLNEALNITNRFSATDAALAGVNNWPTKLDIESHNWAGEFFNSKLSFQIQHGVFRSNMKTGEKSIFEVLKWYDYINSFILDYIAYSIHISSIGGFYWYIIALQDLLRATEYTGASAVYAIRYYTNGNLSAANHKNYIILDALQEEYLHNFYNSMPTITKQLDAIIIDEDIQWHLYNNSRSVVSNNHNIVANKTMAIRQFESMFMYTSALRKILLQMADNIKKMVDDETDSIQDRSKWPIIMLVCLGISIPIIIYLSGKASYSMRQNSKRFDEQALSLNMERRKTDGLLWQLLPADCIAQLKAGQQPKPKLYENSSVFFGDICGFTNLTAMSTAGQTIKFLNELYNMFDAAIDNYDVYKVEIVGDGYLVASGLPKPNGNKHAPEIAQMALQLMNQVVGFQVSHHPNYKLRMRMGIHSGSCVGSVVGSKMPHFSVFGDTVNIAAIMESTSLPLKIQISDRTKKLLDPEVFSTTVRGTTVVPRLGELTTFWLDSKRVDGANPNLGLTPAQAAAEAQQDANAPHPDPSVKTIDIREYS